MPSTRFNYLRYRPQARALGPALRRAAPNHLPAQVRRLEAAQIDGAFVERLLAAINPPGADAFVAKVAA